MAAFFVNKNYRFSNSGMCNIIENSEVTAGSFSCLKPEQDLLKIFEYVWR